MERIFILASSKEDTSQKYEIEKNFWPTKELYHIYELIVKDQFINNTITDAPNEDDRELRVQPHYDRKKIFYNIIEILNMGVIPVFMRNKPDQIEELKAISNDIHIKLNKFTIGVDYTILKYNNDFSAEHLLSSIRSLPTSTEIYVIGYFFTCDMMINIAKPYSKIFPPAPALFMQNVDYFPKANKKFDHFFVSVLFSEQVIQHLRWYIYYLETRYAKYDRILSIEEKIEKRSIYYAEKSMKEGFIMPNSQILNVLRGLGRSTFRTNYMMNYLAIMDENKILIDIFTSDEDVFIYESKNIFIDREMRKDINDTVRRTYAEYAYKILYGVKAFNALEIPNKLYDGFMSILDENERKEIEEYMDNIKKNEVEQRDNRCKHIELTQRLKSNSNQDILRETYDAITALIRKKNDNKMLLCNECGLELICPHELVKVRYTLGEIKTYAEMTTIYKQFTLGANNVNTFYCFICNGLLYSNDIEEMDLIDDEILYVDNSTVWKSAMFLWSQYVVFKDGIYDKAKLIRTMINFSIPIIDARLKLIVNKENIQKYFAIESNIVFVAYLMNLQDATGGKIKFNFNEYMKSVPISEKKTNIKIIEAYRKQFKNIHVDIIDKDLRNNEIMHLPLIITYGELLRKTFDASNIIIESGHFDDREDEDIVANREKQKLIYRQMRILTQKDFPMIAKGRTFYSANECKMLNELSINCFNKWLKFYQYYEDNNEFKNKITEINNPKVTPKAIQDAIDKDVEYFKKKSFYATIKPLLNIKPEKRKIYAEQQTIFSIYNKDGTKHAWDSFVLKDAKGAESIKKIRETKFSDYNKEFKIVDLFSSSTKTRMKETTKLTPEESHKIATILLHKTDLDSIVNFYAIICPEGASHEYKDETCVKCGISNNMDINAKTNYYDKYKDVYNSRKNETTLAIRKSNMNRKSDSSKSKASDFITMLKTKIIDDEMEKKYEKEINSQVDDKMINIVAMKFNIKKTLLIHIGALSRIKYEDIEDSSVVPGYTSDDNDYIYILLNHIKTLISDLRKNDIVFKYLLQCVDLSKYVIKTKPLLYTMNWMRYYLYTALLELSESHMELAKQLFGKILINDAMFCKHKELDETTMEDNDTSTSDVVAGTDVLEVAVENGEGADEGDEPQ